MNRLSGAVLLLTLVVPISIAGAIEAELGVELPIADGVVIQRQVPVPVRGWAAAGAEVAVTLDGKTQVAIADDAGRWRLVLPAHEAGGPYEMKIVSSAETLVVRALLVGDVWLCSGQSNMEWLVEHSRNAGTEIATADDPLIRHFKVPRSWAAAPEPSLAGGAWQSAGPDTVGGFTAVGYFFARSLRPHVDVPIGLVNSTWGGSRIEAWMSPASLGLDGAGMRRLLADERARERQTLERIETLAGGLPASDQGLVDGHARWAEPGFDDSEWHDIPVPSAWEEAGWEGMDGIGWYRTEIELTEGEAAAGMRLGLGTIDDSDRSWVNGHEVGRTDHAWNRPRLYEVPADLLRAGRNVITVRVEDTGGGGGIYGDPELLFVESGDRRRSLAGTWRFQLGAVSLNLDDRKREVPTMLYNQMLHPLLDFPVRGILWYQGESNAWGADAFAYRRLFATMIEDWRRGWGDDTLPFLYAQLASFLPPSEEPGESDWAVLRESQSAALALSNTAQVVLIDAGDADDVHPRNKQTVGERLALAARKVAYGEEIVFSGPVYRRHEVSNGRVVLEFDHVGGGLAAGSGSSERLGGFAIAGADRRFFWAEAEIEGYRVVLRSDQVPHPVAARYGWADNPERANLYNREGLPASPFRTDSWPVGP